MTSFLAVSGLAGAASAGGYALIGQSAASAGVAYAGASALGGRVDTAWYNPAGLAFLDGPVASSSTDVLFPRTDYRDAGSTDALGAQRSGAEVGGAAFGAVPAFYFATPVSDRVSIGVAVNSPFGQKTDYDKDFIGRYEAELSELLAVNLGIVGAVRATDWLSFGAGVDVLYADTRLTNAVDFGAVCLGVVGAACSGLGLLPQTADGRADIEGDGLAVGFNFGVMARFERTRIGLHYRSGIEVDIEGKARFDVPSKAGFLTAGGAFATTGASTELQFPASISLGVAHDVTDRLTLMGELIWTDWSVVGASKVAFDNPAQPDIVLRNVWDDAIYIGLGGTYRWSEALTLRAGVGYDQTPVTDQFRTPRLPGVDTFSVAVGAGWRLQNGWSFDAAYQHFFYDDGDVDISSPEAGRLVGTFSSSADVLSLQATYKF